MRLKARIAIVVVLTLFAAGSSRAGDEDQQGKQRVGFNRDVRRILSDKCFVCHGPDENQRQAELRLDNRTDATASRDGLPAIAPGDAKGSELIRRIFAESEDERMPPSDSGRSALTTAEKSLLRKWIEEGAEYEDHWAYLPPKRTAPPQVKRLDGSPAGPIDAFIIARLQQAGWKMSPPADRRTLIRRLTFDLTGLPPTSDEVAAFVNDETTQAYENLLDRLLASKHFGERMAGPWLDAVRYADTNGIHGDNHREHWLYRDYVINAFNENKPFDVFTREQLAGDLNAKPTREQRIAAGYNRLNMTTREGGAQAKEYRAKYAADRVRNASTVWLGSTMGCSECHDHKFDPFTQRDFYRFAAFFADINEVAVGAQPAEPLPTSDQVARITAIDAALAPLNAQLNTASPAIAKAQQQWEREQLSKRVTWTPLPPLTAESKGGATLTPQRDHSVVASGSKPDRDVYSLTFKSPSPATAIRLEALPHPKAPVKGPGRAANGNFVVTEVDVYVDDRRIELANASGTHSQKGWPDKAAVDGNNDTGWAVLPHTGKANSLVLETKQDAPAGLLKVVIHQNHGRGSHTLARFRLAATDQPRPVRPDNSALAAPLDAILRTPAEKRTKKQADQLAAHYRTLAPALQSVRKQVAALAKERKAIMDSAPKMLVVKRIKPRPTRVLPRGNWLDDSGQLVTPGTPSFLPGPKETENLTRAELAEWVVDDNNPLTARVFVNRLWKLAFGQGIVRTPGDFGSQGEWPSHLELLDNLAVEFRENGWNVKALLKDILMSDAYRQRSAATAEMIEKDPYNRLLARQNRYRMPAEMIRDNALSTSRLMVHRLGGASVKPYQPFGYWSHLNFPKRIYKPDDGENQYRRGLYTYWCRTFLHPSMLAFDAPSREECTVNRPRSNTPLAALVLLNDPTYVESARAMAERVLRSTAKGEQERLVWLFQESLQRKPSPSEQQILLPLFSAHLKDYQAHVETAAKVQKNGFRKPAEDLDPAQLAAWTSVCRIVFNLHEFVNRN